MEAGEPSRKRKITNPVSVSIFSTIIALITLIIPVILINSFSEQDNTNSSPVGASFIPPP